MPQDHELFVPIKGQSGFIRDGTLFYPSNLA